MREREPIPRRPPHPPHPPTPRQAALGNFMLLALAPRVRSGPLPDPPPALAPFSDHAIERPGGPGALAMRRFPVATEARGAVLLVHPWLQWGSAYFYRYGRLEALREAGYEAWTVDLPGFGRSGPRGPWRDFFDRDLAAALAWLRAREPQRSLHVWGVSSGGYWLHPVLSKSRGQEHGVSGAFFEDVASHLLRWSWRLAPWGRPFYWMYRTFLRDAYRFLDMPLHAAARGVRKATYVTGADDLGVPPEDTRAFAELAGGRALIIPGAGHLAAIKVANREVLAAALETFQAAGGGE
jgi:pimeloyl-ACP methyl ester carboxylesterase